MILLGIDTCGATGSLALAYVAGRDLELLASATLAGRTTAAMLIPELETLLARAQVALPSVTGIAVVDGPGSFTGIRIGLSAAKALAEALPCPLFAISRLQVLAAIHHAPCALLDAGRGEFYCGIYPQNPSSPQPIDGAECVLTREQVVERLTPEPAPDCVTCDEKVPTAFPSVALVDPPSAFDALRVALPAILAGRHADVVSLDGRYLRRSDLYRTTNEPQ